MNINIGDIVTICHRDFYVIYKNRNGKMVIWARDAYPLDKEKDWEEKNKDFLKHVTYEDIERVIHMPDLNEM